MGVNIWANRNHLYLDIYWQGLRHRENTGLTVSGSKVKTPEDKIAYRLAEQMRSMREQQLAAGEYGLQDILAGKKPLVTYAETIAAKQPKKNPLPKSLKYLKSFAGTITIGALTSQWLDHYREFLLSQAALSEATASRYLSAVKAVIHKAIREGVIIRDPTDGVKGISVPEAETVHLTLAEVQQLATIPVGGDLGAEVRKAFLFSCFTGLRISDLRSLTWGKISRDPLSIEKRQQKTKALVRIPLNETAWTIIDDKQIHHADEFIFPRLATTKTNTNTYLIEWATNAGIEKRLGWHVARRTFGTLALQAGGDLKTVSSLLGHKKVTHTARYLKTDGDTQRRVIDALPEIDLERRGVIIPIRKTEGEK